MKGFLLRGVVAGCVSAASDSADGRDSACLGAPVSRPRQNNVSWLGFLYGSNIAGAVLGCLLAGFYLLREYDVRTATFAAVAVNVVVAGVALLGQVPDLPASEFQNCSRQVGNLPHGLHRYRSFGILRAGRRSDLDAHARSAAGSVGLYVFHHPGSLSHGLRHWQRAPGPGSAVTWRIRSGRWDGASCWRPPPLPGPLTAWALHKPYWPIDPSISSNIWFNFQLDLARAFWALLPPTLLWGASFPLALAAASDGARSRAGCLPASMRPTRWGRSQARSARACF